MIPRASSSPPKGMTWPRATPILLVCVLFDVARGFFSLFWLLGPVVAAAACLSEAGAVGDLLGSEVTGALCASAAAGAGYFLSPALFSFGTFVAMFLGLTGWMTVWLFLMLNNPRIFKENASALFKLVVTLGIMELPFIGSLPALTFRTFHMYRVQIHHDKKRLQEWRAAQQAQLIRDQQARFAALTEAQAVAEAAAAAEEEAATAEEEARITEEEEAAERAAQEKEKEEEQRAEEAAAREAEEKKVAEAAALAVAHAEAERELDDTARNRYHGELAFSRDVARVVKLARARRRHKLQQHTIKESYEIPENSGESKE